MFDRYKPTTRNNSYMSLQQPYQQLIKKRLQTFSQIHIHYLKTCHSPLPDLIVTMLCVLQLIINIRGGASLHPGDAAEAPQLFNLLL